jgi:hypothetical protein
MYVGVWQHIPRHSHLSATAHTVPSAKPILIPLTSSLYVPGKLSDPENVLVDVGARYFVEKVGRLYLLSLANCLC